MYDILLKNAHIVDGQKNIYGDIAIKNGVIQRIDRDIKISSVMNVIDVKGKLVMPGIIDTHVHLSQWLGGRLGHKMLALAGVTTAFDFSGPVDTVWNIAQKYGKGLNICAINYVRPEYTVESTDPQSDELEKLLIDSLNDGAIGYKLLGGHYPLTQEATKKAIEIGNKHGAYVAFHAGTLETGSNIEGMKEAVKLAGSNSLHLAHINSYCRGQVKTAIEESQEAIELLTKHENIISESYLSPFNGTSANCSNGIPESHVTRKCLEVGGYEISQEGLKKALQDGYANISMEYAGTNKLITGAKGVQVWTDNKYKGTISFAVNPGISRYLLGTHKQENGEFTVKAFSSDGGGIPRNEILYQGLSLVKWGALTINEFVIKSSYNPSRMLGLVNKGKLEEGYDADIIVVDYERNQPIISIIGGKVIMYKGHVTGTNSTVITTEKGVNKIKEYGLSSYVVDLNESMLYGG